MTYQIRMPRTPGATPAITDTGLSLVEARSTAAERAVRRPDLSYQDIRIERLDGSLQECAGPAR